MQQSNLVERASHFEWLRSSYTELWDWCMEARAEIERLRASTNDAPVERLVEARWVIRQAEIESEDPKYIPAWAAHILVAGYREQGWAAWDQRAKPVKRIGSGKWGDALLLLSDGSITCTAALSSPSGEPAVNPTIPAGMKPWHGGDSAPDDWDGGPVLWRAGNIEGRGLRAHSLFWRKDAIIAYTPKPTPTDTADTPPASGLVEAAKRVLALARNEGVATGSYGQVFWGQAVRDLEAALTTAPTAPVEDHPIARANLFGPVSQEAFDAAADWHNNGGAEQIAAGARRRPYAEFRAEVMSKVHREAIAKIIDPSAWRDQGYSWAKWRIEQSLTKADVIASLLPKIPEGWVVVPRDPTEAMLRSGHQASGDFTSFSGLWPRTRAVWSAMLSALPNPPYVGEGGGE